MTSSVSLSSEPPVDVGPPVNPVVGFVQVETETRDAEFENMSKKPRKSGSRRKIVIDDDEPEPKTSKEKKRKGKDRR